MKHKILLLKISFVIMFLIAALHTTILIIGVPLPQTSEFLQMQDAMKNIKVDTGGSIMRTTQNFMDGFNIIVSIFLITLPLLCWMMLSEIKNNESAVRKLTIIALLAEAAFFTTSATLLAIGGTVLSAISCLFLLTSLFLKGKPK